MASARQYNGNKNVIELCRFMCHYGSICTPHHECFDKYDDWLGIGVLHENNHFFIKGSSPSN